MLDDPKFRLARRLAGSGTRARRKADSPAGLESRPKWEARSANSEYSLQGSARAFYE
jgi:hypothetical protein